MATVAGDVAVRVGADTSGLTKGLQEADRSLASFGERAGVAVGKIAALSAAAVAAGVALTASMAAKGFAAVDMLDEMAEKAGTSAKSLQSLQLALGEAGVNSDQTQAAIKKLNLAIGEAQSGNAKAQATFDQLGLSVSELSAMPADQRFAAIADALQGYGNAADRARIMSDLLGAKLGPDMATALQAGGGAIRQATQDLEDMGLAMSDIDAAQVAQAMDSFGRAQGVIDGISNKLAVEFAPLLDAVSKAFIEAGKEGEGFGGGVSAVVEGVIKSVAFLANAIDGIKRIGVAVSDALVYGFAAVQETFYKLARNVMATLDAIPGIDLTANVVELENKIRGAQGVMNEAAANMKRQFTEPLAGDVFLQYAEQAKKASKEAAAAAIAARQEVQGGTAAGGDDPAKAVADKAAIELEAKKQAWANELEAYVAAEAEKSAAADTAAKERAAAALAQMDAQSATEEQKLADKYARQAEIVNAAYETGVITQEERDQRMLDNLVAGYAEEEAIAQESADRMRQLEEQKAAARMASVAGILSQTAALMNSESRKMFELGKVAAISSAIISTYEGIGKAWALGPILGPPMAALVALNGFANVANIRKQSFRGGGATAAASSSNTGAINAANAPVSNGGGQQGGGSLVNISLVGDNFSRDGVLNLIEKINNATATGGARLVFR